MYSRNLGREKRRDLDRVELYSDISDEEYEIYKYNLPPKYDGSRFRRSRQRERRGDVILSEREVIAVEDKNEPHESPRMDEGDHSVVEDSTTAVSEAQIHADRQLTLPNIFNSIGYEELLIIALILVIADGDSGGDVLLLLALLLTKK